MYGKNRHRLDKPPNRNDDGRAVGDNSTGKMCYQILQLLHHIGVVTEQSEGNLPQSFSPKKLTTLTNLYDPPRLTGL
jgi:hypothetical protein